MTREARLLIVLSMNLVLLRALVVVGLTAHSLGVLAAGGDHLADSAAIGLALLALRLGKQRSTAGRSHATANAALGNASVLLAVMVLVLLGSILRLAHGATKVDGLPVVIVNAVAALVMIAGAIVLQGDTDEHRHLGDEAVMR